jgi:hypothetical protein
MRFLCFLAATTPACSRSVCDRIADTAKDCGGTTSTAWSDECAMNYEACTESDDAVLHGFLDCMDEGEVWSCDSEGSEVESDPTTGGLSPTETCFAMVDQLTPACHDGMFSYEAVAE